VPPQAPLSPLSYLGLLSFVHTIFTNATQYPASLHPIPTTTTTQYSEALFLFYRMSLFITLFRGVHPQNRTFQLRYPLLAHLVGTKCLLLFLHLRSYLFLPPLPSSLQLAHHPLRTEHPRTCCTSPSQPYPLHCFQSSVASQLRLSSPLCGYCSVPASPHHPVFTILTLRATIPLTYTHLRFFRGGVVLLRPTTFPTSRVASQRSGFPH
jgi:hypothetical protein